MPRPEWSMRVSNREMRQREKQELRKPQSIPAMTLADEEAAQLTASEARAAQQAITAARSPQKPSTPRQQVRSPSATSPSGIRSPRSPASSRSGAGRRSPSKTTDFIPVGEVTHLSRNEASVVLQGLIPGSPGTTTTTGSSTPTNHRQPQHLVYVVASPHSQHLEPDPPYPLPDTNTVQPGIRFAHRVASPPRCRKEESPKQKGKGGGYSGTSPSFSGVGGGGGNRARSPSPKPVEAERLPVGWRSVKTPDGKQCYLHEASDRAEWQQPKDNRPASKVQVPQEDLSGDVLPHGWRAIRSPNGLLCYVHGRSPNAVWSIPTSAKRNPHANTHSPTPTTTTIASTAMGMTNPSPDQQQDILVPQAEEIKKYFPLPNRELDKPNGRRRRNSSTGAKSPTSDQKRFSPSSSMFTSPLSPLSSPSPTSDKERNKDKKVRRPSSPPPPVLPDKPRLPSPLRKTGRKCNKEGHKTNLFSNQGLAQGPYGPSPFDDRTEYRVEYSPGTVSTANHLLDDGGHYAHVGSPSHTEYRTEFAQKYQDDALPAGTPSCQQWYGPEESFTPQQQPLLGPPGAIADPDFLAACHEVQALVADFHED